MDYIFLVSIIICGISDFKTRIIPNKITIPLIAFCFLYQAYRGKISYSLLGFALSLGIGMICYLTKGMGMGDVKLMAAIGAYLGSYSYFCILFIASLIGAVWGIVVFAKSKLTLPCPTNSVKKKNKNYIPFGTCLSLALMYTHIYPFTILPIVFN